MLELRDEMTLLKKSAILETLKSQSLLSQAELQYLPAYKNLFFQI